MGYKDDLWNNCFTFGAEGTYKAKPLSKTTFPLSCLGEGDTGGEVGHGQLKERHYHKYAH